MLLTSPGPGRFEKPQRTPHVWRFALPVATVLGLWCLATSGFAEVEFTPLPLVGSTSLDTTPRDATAFQAPAETPYKRSQWLPHTSGTELFVDVEIVTLKPRFEDGAEEDFRTRLFDFKLQPSPRVSLAVSNPSGLAIRSRYWQYDSLSTVTPGRHVLLAGIFDRMWIDAYTIELDMAQRLDIGPLRLDLGLGARNALFQQGVESTDVDDFASKTFHGMGPVMSIDSLRPIGNLGFEWVGNVRSSILVGETKWANMTRYQVTDDIGATFDVRMGLQWRRCCGRFGEFLARAVWEQQMWFGAGSFFNSTASPAAAALNVRADDHDVAFMGFAFAVGLQR